LVGLTGKEMRLKFGLPVFSFMWWLSVVSMTSEQRQAWSQASATELLNIAVDLRKAPSQGAAEPHSCHASSQASEWGWPMPHAIAAALGAEPAAGGARKRPRE
jgi:hypothetical protein